MCGTLDHLMHFGARTSHVFAHPLAFALAVLRAFRKNQGLLLAGAVAYYALLSIVPLLILSVIALSHFIGQDALLATLARYLEWLVPGQSAAVVAELAKFLAHRDVLGLVLLVTMLFFSSLAFSVLESAMSVIFHHRLKNNRRNFIVSVLMPYGYILCLALGLLLMTMMTGRLQGLGEQSLLILDVDWPLGRLSAWLLYLLGFVGEVLAIASIYLVMPVGRLSVKHALIGALTAAVLWEGSRHLLGWYFATLSQIGAVYGSLTTAIAVLLSLEVAATLLLLGAQVIAEFERVSGDTARADRQPIATA